VKPIHRHLGRLAALPGDGDLVGAVGGDQLLWSVNPPEQQNCLLFRSSIFRSNNATNCSRE
jgi:hypothetical protein